MKSWLISIAAISILSAIADMFLPSSQVSRYAKLCISLLLTTIIVRPLTGFYNKDFSVSLPQTEQITQLQQSSLVDGEFSSRLTDSLKTETGFGNIKLDAKLGYDRVLSVHVTGAEQWQKEKINNVLADKYKIPTEIVTYGAD